MILKVTDSIMPPVVKDTLKQMLRFDRKERIKGKELVNSELLQKNKNKKSIHHEKCKSAIV